MNLKKIAIVSVLLTLLLTFPAKGWAQETEGASEQEKFFSMEIDGFYRLRWTRISEIDAFPQGPVPRVNYWDQRLRLAPELHIRPDMFLLKRVSFFTVADIWDGSFDIDDEAPPNLEFDLRTWEQSFLAEDSDWNEDGFWWREYWTEIDLTAVVIRVGRMGSTWGTRMLASGSELSYSNDFGDSYWGDTVDRVLVATKPIDLISTILGGDAESDIIMAFAYDWNVVQDKTGEEDDNASQYIIAIQKEPEEIIGKLYHDLSLGAYYVRRKQDANTEATVYDFTASLPILLRGGDIKLTTSLEALYITGETDENRSNTAPEGSDIKMYGFLVNIAAETKRLDLISEVGLASGDPNPFDDEISNLTFNRDYNVGLLMFERVLAAATANSSYQFSDPSLSNQAPAGIDLLPTNGSLTNAFYLYPRIKFRPVKDFEMVFGFLYAIAPEHLVDPYQSFLNGGVATNYNGGDTDDNIGVEFDLGASYTFGDPDKKAIRIGGQWGWFWPGDAWNYADGSSMDKVEMGQFRFDILF